MNSGFGPITSTPLGYKDHAAQSNHRVQPYPLLDSSMYNYNVQEFDREFSSKEELTKAETDLFTSHVKTSKDTLIIMIQPSLSFKNSTPRLMTNIQ